MASGNAFVDWLQGHTKPPAPAGIRHPLQVMSSSARETLLPVANRVTQEIQGKFYLPHPGAYIGPVNHSRIASHQAIHQQDPQTLYPNITSRYVAAIKQPGLRA